MKALMHHGVVVFNAILQVAAGLTSALMHPLCAVCVPTLTCFRRSMASGLLCTTAAGLVLGYLSLIRSLFHPRAGDVHNQYALVSDWQVKPVANACASPWM